MQMEGRRGSDALLVRPNEAGRSATGLEKLVASQAGIAWAAVRIEDPEVGGSAGWRVSVAHHLGSGQLADHVAAELDPRLPPQLEVQSGRLLDRRGDRGRQTRRLQDDQLDLGAPGDRGQSMHPVRGLRRAATAVADRGSRRQIQEQQIHRAILQEHGRHTQRLVQRVRRQDHEPLELDAPRDGLDRIQAPGQVQIRGDAARRLGLRDGLESQRGLAAGAVALEGDRRGSGQAAQPENRIEGSEAGRDDELAGLRKWLPEWRFQRRFVESRIDREGALDPGRGLSRRPAGAPANLAAPTRCRPAEASSEGLERGLDFGRSGRHGPQMVEQTF